MTDWPLTRQRIFSFRCGGKDSKSLTNFKKILVEKYSLGNGVQRSMTNRNATRAFVYTSVDQRQQFSYSR